MQHQINVDESGNPIYINLEYSNGDLIIKDHDQKLIKKPIGKPSKNRLESNLPFEDIEEAYQWFISTNLANRLDIQEEE